MTSIMEESTESSEEKSRLREIWLWTGVPTDASYRIMPMDSNVQYISPPLTDHIPEEVIASLVDNKKKNFEILGAALNCLGYKVNLIEFWFIDIVEECIIEAKQYKELLNKNICFIVDYLVSFMKTIKSTDLTLDQMFYKFTNDVTRMVDGIKCIQLESKGRNSSIGSGTFYKHRSSDINMSDIFDVPVVQQVSREDSTIPLCGSLGSLDTSDTSKFAERGSSRGCYDSKVMEAEAHIRQLNERNEKCLKEIQVIIQYIYKAFADTFAYNILQMSLQTNLQSDNNCLELPYRMEYPKEHMPADVVKKYTAHLSEMKKKKVQFTGICPMTSSFSGSNYAVQIKEDLNVQYSKVFILPLTLAVEEQFYTDLFQNDPRDRRISTLKKKKSSTIKYFVTV